MDLLPLRYMEKSLIAVLIYDLHSKFSIIICLAQVGDFSLSSLND